MNAVNEAEARNGPSAIAPLDQPPTSDRSADRPLTGRTALITGASRGIGAACARRLAALGATLVVTYRSGREEAEALAADLQDQYAVTVHPLPFDLTAPASAPAGVGTMLDAARQAAGNDIDVLVANAAAPYPKVGLLELTAEQFVSKLGQDLGTTHQLVTAVAPGMVDRGFGRIVLIGSLHADGPTAPGMTANGVSKAALATYVEYAADELTGPGVTINIAHPGYIATEATGHLPAAVPALLDAMTPAGRTGMPDDVAGVIAMLTRPEAVFLNGTVLPVAGGLNHPVSVRRLAARS